LFGCWSNLRFIIPKRLYIIGDIGSTEKLPSLMSLLCLDFSYLFLGCIQFDHTYNSMHHGTLEFETYPKIIPTDKLTVKVYTFCSGEVLIRANFDLGRKRS